MAVNISSNDIRSTLGLPRSENITFFEAIQQKLGFIKPVEITSIDGESIQNVSGIESAHKFKDIEPSDLIFDIPSVKSVEKQGFSLPVFDLTQIITITDVHKEESQKIITNPEANELYSEVVSELNLNYKIKYKEVNDQNKMSDQYDADYFGPKQQPSFESTVSVDELVQLFESLSLNNDSQNSLTDDFILDGSELPQLFQDEAPIVEEQHIDNENVEPQENVGHEDAVHQNLAEAQENIVPNEVINQDWVQAIGPDGGNILLPPPPVATNHPVAVLDLSNIPLPQALLAVQAEQNGAEDLDIRPADGNEVIELHDVVDLESHDDVAHIMEDPSSIENGAAAELVVPPIENGLSLQAQLFQAIRGEHQLNHIEEDQINTHAAELENQESDGTQIGDLMAALRANPRAALRTVSEADKNHHDSPNLTAPVREESGEGAALREAFDNFVVHQQQDSSSTDSDDSGWDDEEDLTVDYFEASAVTNRFFSVSSQGKEVTESDVKAHLIHLKSEVLNSLELKFGTLAQHFVEKLDANLVAKDVNIPAENESRLHDVQAQMSHKVFVEMDKFINHYLTEKTNSMMQNMLEGQDKAFFNVGDDQDFDTALFDYAKAQVLSKSLGDYAGLNEDVDSFLETMDDFVTQGFDARPQYGSTYDSGLDYEGRNDAFHKAQDIMRDATNELVEEFKAPDLSAAEHSSQSNNGPVIDVAAVMRNRRAAMGERPQDEDSRTEVQESERASDSTISRARNAIANLFGGGRRASADDMSDHREVGDEGHDNHEGFGADDSVVAHGHDGGVGGFADMDGFGESAYVQQTEVIQEQPIVVDGF